MGFVFLNKVDTVYLLTASAAVPEENSQLTGGEEKDEGKEESNAEKDPSNTEPTITIAPSPDDEELKAESFESLDDGMHDAILWTK